MDEKIKEVGATMLAAINDCKLGRITVEELRALMYRIAGELEAGQWEIIENLRTKAPENESELARAVADVLEAGLRDGSGNA